MNTLKKNIIWFTLIEIVVTITILSIIIVSVMTIFISTTDISKKSDINRSMQENLKNVISIISEDIMKNGISWVSVDSLDSCNFSINTWNHYKAWNKLCTSLNNYYLAHKVGDDYMRTDISNCSNIWDSCVIYKHLSWPITNSLVSVKDLKFYASSEWTSKVTVVIVIQPSVKKWIKTNLIKESKLVFETTISENPF